jgi:hypothetical protein
LFAEAGWSKAQAVERIVELTTRPGSELVRGAGGIAEGLPESFAGADVPKFRLPGGLKLIHAGGGAGLFAMMIGGWVAGAVGSDQVCREVTS